jgi:NAD(P)-dependent dehydrogenase (short-subunit alcohol dehydrogenase family)
MRSVTELMDLTGRTALVTGGAGHVGLAACEALLELGCDVAILDVDASACEERVNELSRIWPQNVLAVPCDLIDEQTSRGAVQEAVENLGRLDILIHCAGYVGTTQLSGWAVPFEEQTVAAWDAAIRVNLTSAFVIVQEAREALTSSGHGAVVLVSSIYGLVGPDLRMYRETNISASPAAYAASKAGLLQLTRYFATLLAPAVRANTITPGGIRRNQPDDFDQRYVSRTPLRRMATEEDLKGAMAYLASDLSMYVTGHNLVVDGGWTAW